MCVLIPPSDWAVEWWLSITSGCAHPCKSKVGSLHVCMCLSVCLSVCIALSVICLSSIFLTTCSQLTFFSPSCSSHAHNPTFLASVHTHLSLSLFQYTSLLPVFLTWEPTCTSWWILLTLNQKMSTRWSLMRYVFCGGVCLSIAKCFRDYL